MEENGDDLTGLMVGLSILLLVIGILLTIPTTEETIGSGDYAVTYTVPKFGYIGYYIIGIFWLPLLYVFYKKFVPEMARTYGRAMGEGLSRGMPVGKRVCPNCNLINDATARFCVDCGQKLKP